MIHQMYGKPKRTEVRVVFNSKRAKVMLRRPTAPQPGEVKIVFTLKPKHFSGNGAGGSGDFEENFDQNIQKLLAKPSNMHLTNLLKNGLA